MIGNILAAVTGAGGVVVATLWGVAAFQMDAALDAERERSALLYQQCFEYREQVQYLTEQLSQATVKKSQFTFHIMPDEFAPKTLARVNRNLLNIKTLSGSDTWVGQIGVDKHKHVIFAHPAYSVRAGAMLLKNYERRHKIDSIHALVQRFCEGNREAYIRFLCDRLNVEPKQKISLIDNMHKLLPAMIKFETGEDVGMEYTGIIEAVLK